MRLLHTISQLPGKTGSGIFLQELFRVAKEKGYTQGVLAGIPASGYDVHIEGLEHFFPVRFNTPALPFEVVGMSDVMPYPSRTFSSLSDQEVRAYEEAFTEGIHRAIKTFKPDVILGNHLWILSALICKLYPKIPFLCLCHGTDLRQHELAPHLGARVGPWLQGCKQIFALNALQKETIVKRFGIKETAVCVNGSGYDAATFFPTPKPSTPPVHVLYIGKLSNAKGVPSLLRAMERLPFSPDEVTLTCIGGGSGPETEAILAQLSSTPFRALGFVAHETLIEHLHNSHVFVLPSFYEGLPLVVLEALASGLGVVCTDLPGLKEFLGPLPTGAITYVPLPPMATVDVPKEEGLPAFEKALGDALHGAINAQLQGQPLNTDALQHALLSKSWKGVFERLEAYM